MSLNTKLVNVCPCSRTPVHCKCVSIGRDCLCRQQQLCSAKCDGMTLFLSAAVVCMVIIGSVCVCVVGSLGLLQCPFFLLLFLSANVESIFAVAMETIVFVVAVIGAAGRARLCYFCRKSTPDTRAPTFIDTHTQCTFTVHTHMSRCAANLQFKWMPCPCSFGLPECEGLRGVMWLQYVSPLSSVVQDILIHLHHDNRSK